MILLEQLRGLVNNLAQRSWKLYEDISADSLEGAAISKEVRCSVSERNGIYPSYSICIVDLIKIHHLLTEQSLLSSRSRK